jgi:hypothetical protein
MKLLLAIPVVAVLAFAAVPASRHWGVTSALAATAAAADARQITIPAGTAMSVVLDTTVGSDISRVEQPVHAHVSRAVTVHGVTVLPVGSTLTGVVTAAKRSGKVKGLGHIAVVFDRVTSRATGERYALRTAPVARTAAPTKARDAEEIAGAAGAGALIGALAGGKKGALIGTAVGGGAGTAVVLEQRGKEVRLARGRAVRLRLTAPLSVRIKND